MKSKEHKRHGTAEPPSSDHGPEEAAPVMDEPVCAETMAPTGLEAALAACIQERDNQKDQVLRVRAEFDNYRKRILRENEQLRVTAAQGIIRDLLPVRDNLERALNHAEDASGGLADGVRMIMKQFDDVLAARGLEAIPASGYPFDPNVHEALSSMPSEEFEAGMIMMEFERGYRLGGAVLRPSKVVVSSGSSVQAEPVEATERKEQDSTDLQGA